MPKAKRILVIGEFKNKLPASIRPPRRHWVKGLTRLGHDVHTFSMPDLI